MRSEAAGVEVSGIFRVPSVPEDLQDTQSSAAKLVAGGSLDSPGRLLL
jgi:hypothetical protein